MIIGVNGLKGAGKDTVGAYLVERHGFVRLSFAELLKVSAAALFNITPTEWDEYKNRDDVTIELHVGKGRGSSIIRLTAREFLQRYGTESHRDVFGQDFWVDALLNELERTDPGRVLRGVRKRERDYVITDARFENELMAIIQLNGFTFQVVRDVEDGDTHASEVVPDDELITYVVENYGTIEELHEEIDAILAELRS